MLQPGRKYSSGNGYRYGFNGKENDKEVVGDGNEYDYGFRIYNPRIGKFLSVDPLYRSFPWNSSYVYTEDDPINYIDLDGGEQPVQRAQSNALPTLPVFVTPNGSLSPNSNPTQLINGPVNAGLLTPQTKTDINLGNNYDGITQEKIQSLLTRTAFEAKITSDGTGYVLQVEDANGRYYVKLYKPNAPPHEVTWMDRAAKRANIENAKLFNITKWNVEIQAVEIITTEPASLSDGYLDEVNRRLLNGTATANDRLYANEVAARKHDGRIKDPEMVEYIQGRGENARKVTAYVPKGYRKTNLKSHGQAVFTNGKTWISPDQDGHKGGVWKMFDNDKNVNSTDKNKRMGTYDANLKRVDD